MISSSSPRTETAPAAALEAVEVDYPGRGRALGPITLSIAPEEVVALVGDNAAS